MTKHEFIIDNDRMIYMYLCINCGIRGVGLTNYLKEPPEYSIMSHFAHCEEHILFEVLL
jgi:hypothetical protein